MQYAAVLLSTLATTALTAPLNSRQTQAGRPDNGIQIVLENADTHLTSTHNLQGDENLKLETSIPGQQSFTSINVLLGNNIKNKDLRCEALDENHKPIAGKRGENVSL